MTFQEMIVRRQSCRRYDPDREVPRESILACIEAARLAPSAHNVQPYRITAFTGGEARRAADCAQVMGANAFAAKAPCILIFSEEPSAAASVDCQKRDFASVDIGIAAAHLTLRATDLGLDTCILGLFDEEKAQALLGAAGRVRLMVALGYAVPGYPVRPKTRRPMEEFAEIR